MRRAGRWAGCLLWVGLAWGCGESAPAPGVQTLPLTLRLLDDTVVTGGSLPIEVEGAQLLVPGRVEVGLDGDLGGVRFEASFQAIPEDGTDPLLVRLPWDALDAVLPIEERAGFEGALRVEVDDLAAPVRGEGALSGARITFARALVPRVALPAAREVHLGERLVLEAEGLLQEAEGQTELRLDGVFSAEGGEERIIEAVLPVRPDGGDRARASVQLEPELFGLAPGVYEGRATVTNRHRGAEATLGNAQEVRWTQAPTSIAGFDPPAASRGEVVRVFGQGFVEASPANSRSMVLEFEGTFYPYEGEPLELGGDDALRLAPEGVPDHTEARLVLRSEAVEGEGPLPTLVGLTARPGRFEGTVTPILLNAREVVRGEAWRGDFVIAPTKQVVFLKYLPGFSEALEEYGLRNVEPEIRARILEVLRRDYAGVNIEFTDERPDAFAEYSVIELGGSDPNNAGLFGLDNTAGKDTGNVRLDDVVGGQNAESGELGFYVYGGVFIRSFRAFSPSLSQDMTIASARFDELYGPFMRELGGSPVVADEWPQGSRRSRIAEAVRTMGNLIGNTVSHEVGHSLGLAFFAEDLEAPSTRYHSEGDEPNSLMDGGPARPFEERVEVDGQGPQVFSPDDLAYLLQILPLP